MQDRYAGDIGDFLKFSLLRQLCQPSDVDPGLRLGVVWYLAPDEDHNLDGKHTPYLDSPKPRDRELTALESDRRNSWYSRPGIASRVGVSR